RGRPQKRIVPGIQASGPPRPRRRIHAPRVGWSGAAASSAAAPSDAATQPAATSRSTTEANTGWATDTERVWRRDRSMGVVRRGSVSHHRAAMPRGAGGDGGSKHGARRDRSLKGGLTSRSVVTRRPRTRGAVVGALVLDGLLMGASAVLA